MQKKYDKDLRFVFKAFVCAFVIMLVLHVVNFFIAVPDPKATEIKTVMHAVQPIRGSDVRGRLVDPSGKPVIVVVYASWCGICHRVLPELAKLSREGKLDGFQPIFLSVDHQFDSLAKYLVESGLRDVIHPPYVVKQSAFNTLEGALASAGVQYNRALPYMLFLDREGKAVAEITGATNRATLLKALEIAKP